MPIALHEHFLQLIALVLLALLLLTYAPRITTALSEKLATATSTPMKVKVRL